MRRSSAPSRRGLRSARTARRSAGPSVASSSTVIERSGAPTALTTPSTLRDRRARSPAPARRRRAPSRAPTPRRAGQRRRPCTSPSSRRCLRRRAPSSCRRMTTRTLSGERPNAAAAMIAKPELTPLMSAADVTTVIVPSESTRQTAAAGSSPPGQWPAAIPIPSSSGSESRAAHSGCSRIRSRTSTRADGRERRAADRDVAFDHGVRQSQLDRVELELRGELVEERLEREGGGRRPGAR